jgi:hypothetical protein
VKLKVNPEDDLTDEQERDEGCEAGVNIMAKLTAFVCVAEKPADNCADMLAHWCGGANTCNDTGENLHRHMPS